MLTGRLPGMTAIGTCRRVVRLKCDSGRCVPGGGGACGRYDWNITRGKGVTVAVVDSGINQSHPQLAGRVVKTIGLTHTHNTDCYGHGTAVAGIIAAQDERNSKSMPFVGVAPDIRLISIKIQ